MKRTVIGVLVFALLAGFAGSAGFAQEKPAPADSAAKAEKVDESKSDKKDEKKEEKKKETYIKDKVKDHDVFQGLFTIYQNKEDGSTFLEIKKDQIGKEFIYFKREEFILIIAYTSSLPFFKFIYKARIFC